MKEKPGMKDRDTRCLLTRIHFSHPCYYCDTIQVLHQILALNKKQKKLLVSSNVDNLHNHFCGIVKPQMLRTDCILQTSNQDWSLMLWFVKTEISFFLEDIHCIHIETHFYAIWIITITVLIKTASVSGFFTHIFF